MKIKFWQVLCFVIAVIGTSFLVFPGNKSLVMTYLEMGLPEMALVLVEKLHKRSPDDLDVYHMAAKTLLLSGDTLKAESYLEEGVKRFPENRELVETLATLYENTRNKNKAKIVLNKIARYFPDNKEALEKLLYFYRYEGNIKEESRIASELVRLEHKKNESQIFGDKFYKTSGSYILELAERTDKISNSPYLDLLFTKLFVLKREYYKAHKDKSPLDPELFVYRYLEQFVMSGYIEDGILFASSLDENLKAGLTNRLKFVDVLRWNGLEKNALTVLEKLSLENPSDIKLLVKVGELGKVTDQIESSIVAYEELAGLEPEKLSHLEKLASLYLESDRVVKAYGTLKTISEKTGGEKGRVSNMIDVASLSGDVEIIKASLIKAAALRPLDGEILLRLADFLLGEGSDREAIEILKKYLILDPTNSDVRLQLARVYIWNNKSKEAFRQAMIVATASGNKKNALLESARIAEQGGLSEQALKIYKRLNVRFPKDEYIANQVLRLALFKNEEKEVAKQLSRIADKYPEDYSKNLKAGEANISIGELNRGIRYLETAVWLKPEDTKTRKRLVTYYGWAEKPDKVKKAIEEYVKAGGLKDRPVDSKFLSESGETILFTNNTDLALKLFEAVLKQDSDNVKALKYSSKIYAEKKQERKAIKLLERYTTLAPKDYEAGYLLGELYMSAGRKEKAFDQFRKVLKTIELDKKNSNYSEGE